MDLRVYEKRFRHELDVIFEAFNEIEIEYGDDEDDDDDFGSVFEGNIYSYHGSTGAVSFSCCRQGNNCDGAGVNIRVAWSLGAPHLTNVLMPHD